MIFSAVAVAAAAAPRPILGGDVVRRAAMQHAARAGGVGGMVRGNWGVMDHTREANPPQRAPVVDNAKGVYIAGGSVGGTVLSTIGAFLKGIVQGPATPATGAGTKRARQSRTNGRNASGRNRDNAVACTCGADAEFRRNGKKGPPWAQHKDLCKREEEFARRRKARKLAKKSAKGGGGGGQRPLQFS